MGIEYSILIEKMLDFILEFITDEIYLIEAYSIFLEVLDR